MICLYKKKYIYIYRWIMRSGLGLPSRRIRNYISARVGYNQHLQKSELRARYNIESLDQNHGGYH